MPETATAVERKTSDTVMGAGASTLALDVPFPIGPKEKSKLDLLTMVVTHILSTPDIYDINNLARPGVCGDYAVVLKEQIDKKFLPFIADVSGQRYTVAYQNPEKLIKDKSRRAKICSDLAETALRLASIVLACLASIQVASETRVGQKGGGSNEVLPWLIANKMAANATTTLNQPIPLTDPNPSEWRADSKTYVIQITKSENTITYANLSQQGEQGSLRIQFLNPIIVPGTVKQMLPIRVIDNTGIPWMVGVMYENIYKPLGKEPHTSAFNAWGLLFRKSRGDSGPLLENDFNQLQTSSRIFDQVKNTGRPDGIFQALTQFMTEHIPDYKPAMSPVNPYAPNPYAPNPYAPNPYVPNPYAPNPYAPVNPYNPYVPPANPYGQMPYRPQAGLQINPVQAVQYAIPDQQATRSILAMLGSFKDLFTKTSCPASVRANTLSMRINSDRTIRSGVCMDPYWKEPNLGRIYPYATFQFLCMKDWKTAGKSGSTEELKQFTEGLKQVYADGLSGTGSLDTIKFRVTPPICSENQGREINVKYQAVQKGLQAINAEYAAHTKEIWGILSNLVEVIEDPETKTEVVRLVPNATKTTTKDYIEGLAVKARNQIGGHYVRLEGIYYETVKALT
jgi:hypothetical protein